MKSSSEALDLSGLLDESGSKPAQGKALRSIGLRVNKEDFGKADSLRHAVLTLVVAEEYPRAIARLKEFQEGRGDYPQFEARAGRYLSYAMDLIHGIKAKRSFPGVHALAMSKQQELYDRATEHFVDLTATLRKVERIDREVRAEDARSTVWIVKTVVLCLIAVMAVAFVREVSRGVLPSIHLVVDDAFDRTTNWLFDTLRI